ncbi:bifunctional diaminohydroxyphosphoribosylaminopyrimidine deaminase/5-amino-6-(5-phosphoribosylamino)uracil reductase RibD [Maribacter aestuarii]|uniref:bifunctional diaminohydroxyphosphoribosylaminopyrimidine deaminase/5-amino-6-(5-phosphoribosylamino)uracil reductase RibD n=1 Tax=Maribacter aestuarii TaxID=1130723 RepID=UPI00248C1973|nr:bifunctional diaminohydroxyphosphoribosylaminopyrimidine deaminase/5-amino-6-(5-phosphoribosylamino)uracil reductase RibD [Maribacter aestuarii]
MNNGPTLKVHILDEIFMQRCIQIAKNGLGTTAPNPMVGAVIVHEKVIIGEGYTSPYGGNHAEVNAINSVIDKTLLPKATLYVTLEPCSHFGKTPPCVDLIIKHGINRVVIGVKDPHDKVAGKGIEQLKNFGCEVVVGVLEQACAEHHKRFLTYHTKKRPYIILKWAETNDGFIAPTKEMRHKNPEPYWITGTLSRQLVHKWRNEEQAILVGTQTVIDDNPKLDVRQWTGKSPIRIVLDSNLKIPASAHVLNGAHRTIVMTSVTDKSLYQQHVEYHVLDPKTDTTEGICSALYELNIQSLIIEGGAKTLQSFIDANKWDEVRIFKGSTNFEKGIAAPRIKGTLVTTTQLREDSLTLLKND